MPQNRQRSSHRSLKFQQLEQRCLLDASALRITEFLASNDITLDDFEGDSSDWLEIFNPSASTVSLDGLYLTDDSEELNQWQFPTGQTIDPGEFLVVFASNKDLVAPNGELHTNFAISAGGEYLALVDVDGSTVIDEYSPEFPQQEGDVSYGLAMASTSTTLVAEGAAARAWRPTSGANDAVWTGVAFDDSGVYEFEGPTGFGYENSGNPNPDYDDYFNSEIPVGTTSLYVRVPFDLSSLEGISSLTLRMQYDDGFVAYLNGVQIASANVPESVAWNSTATTFHDDFNAIQFLEFDVSAAISSLIVGDNVLAIHGLNFGPGSSDFLITPELVASQSVIASPENVGYFEEPTPGAANGEAFAGYAEAPSFSVPHGFYTTVQQVSLASGTAGALIVYTTDGSTPAVDQNLNPINGVAYPGPITVSETTTIRATAFKQDFKPSYVQASSYLFLDDIVNQSPTGQAPAGWPNFNVNGQDLDYGIDPEIVSQYGAQAVKDSLAAIPSIALTTDIENLFDSNTGIYVNAWNRGREWERATSVELIDSEGGEGFSTNAGLRIRGGYGRRPENPKHAFRLYFRGEYGDGMLNYPLFGDEGTDEFDVLDLRTASNYGWSTWGGVNGLQNSFLREVFSRDTQADMEQPYTRSRYYHLYLNGEYWGLYMTQERVQEDFGASYFGGDKEDYDVVKSDSTESYTFEVSDGNDDAWQLLFDMAQDLANSPTANADNYWAMQGLNPDGTRDEELEVLLDVDNLIDYMMIIIYTGGHDTGISRFLGTDRANNWFGIRNRETGDQGFQFFLHDNEHSLGAGEHSGSLHGTIGYDQTGPFYVPNDSDYNFFNPVFLHQDLLVHPEYVQRFVDRVQELMFNDGALTLEQNIARMEQRKDEVEPAIIAEAARWGDAQSATPRDKATWDAEVTWLLNTGLPIRNNLVIGQLQADGLYNQLGAPSFSQHGGEVTAGYPLQITASQGTIYYSLDGATDPRLIGGGVDPSAEVQQYSGPIVLTENTTVWARLREPSGQWSGLVATTFTVPQLAGDYNQDGSVDRNDYLVWRNAYGSDSDLSADGNENGVVDAGDYTVWRDALAQQPIVVTPASASPVLVTEDSTDLSVLGDAGVGEEGLLYTWAATGPDDVIFSSNGTNSSKNTTVTFAAAGEYQFVVAIENPSIGSVTTSNVLVTVEQTVSGLAVEPAESFVAAGGTVQLSAFEIDQFGGVIGAPTDGVWSILSGAGSVDQNGLFSAPLSEGTTTVVVEASSGTAGAVLNVLAPSAWYQADSSAGSTLVDSSGNGNDGNVIGSAGWSPGIDGNSLSLTGGHVELPNGIVSGINDITISTWFNLDNVGTWSRVFDFGSGTGLNMFLTPEAGFSGGPMRFSIKPAGQGEQQLDGPSISAGQWYHVAVTIEDDTGSLYLNGSLVASNPAMTVDPADLNFTTQNYLGDSQYPADPPLFGRIDDFRIYAEALPAEQIAQLVGASSALQADFTEIASAMTVAAPDVSGDTLQSSSVYPWSLLGESSAFTPLSSKAHSVVSAAVADLVESDDELLQASLLGLRAGMALTSPLDVQLTSQEFIDGLAYANAAETDLGLQDKFRHGVQPLDLAFSEMSTE